MEAVKGGCVIRSEKTEKHVDSSVSATPMNMVKPNRTRVENFPLTPPRSVSFSNEELVTEYDTYIPVDMNLNNKLAISPGESIDIPARELSQDILVAMVNRDIEMKELFVCNKDFFDTVKQCIFEDDKTWNDFLQVLYSKREKIPDSSWMDSISEFLSPNPPFLVKFKQIIGFYENDDDDDVSSVQEDNEETYYCESMNDAWLDITPIRDFVGNLEGNYPQFFINVRESLGEERQRRGSLLGGNHLCNDNSPLHPNAESEDTSETPYEEFKRILLTLRSEMDDPEWETAIYECLDPWPLLIAQFEDIIKYEISAISE